MYVYCNLGVQVMISNPLVLGSIERMLGWLVSQIAYIVIAHGKLVGCLTIQDIKTLISPLKPFSRPYFINHWSGYKTQANQLESASKRNQSALLDLCA